MASSSSPAPAAAGSTTPAHLRCREWYDTHGAAVYGYLRFHLSLDEAEDLTADVFLRAMRAADRFDPSRGGPRTWLLRIARNALRDHRRRERRRREVPLGGMDDLRCEAPSPEERLLWEEEVARLVAAVGRLGAGDREIIGLRYGSGLDTADTAEVLGVGQSVVRTRLWRALARLRKALDS